MVYYYLVLGYKYSKSVLCRRKVRKETQGVYLQRGLHCFEADNAQAYDQEMGVPYVLQKVWTRRRHECTRNCVDCRRLAKGHICRVCFTRWSADSYCNILHVHLPKAWPNLQKRLPLANNRLRLLSLRSDHLLEL